jgi:hypothetical protein
LLRRFTVLLALVLSAVVVSTPAYAGTESEFVSRMNYARTSRGLRAYPVRSDLVSVARRQAARMAAQHRMFHNPNLGAEVTGWRNVGENVGEGPDVASIHNAFMGSASHRENILSTVFTEVGVGTARGSDGVLYVSQVFRRPWGTVYTPPPPQTTPVYRPTAQRASRSAPRAPIVRTVRKRVVADPLPGRLRSAWRQFRRERPVDPIERAVEYVRTNRTVSGAVPLS